MATLTERLTEAASDLDAITNQLAGLGAIDLPSSTRDFYNSLRSWPPEILEAIQLIKTREFSLRQIDRLSAPSMHCRSENANVLLNGESIPYVHARLMCFQSYMASTWAAYDKLAEVCGRLCLNEAQAKNLSLSLNLMSFCKNPQVKVEGIGFLFATQLREAFGWPIGFSYACRNCIMHDGHFHNGAMLFDGNDRLVAQHRINRTVNEAIKKRCEEYGVQEDQTLAASRLPDPETDFLGYLKICHEEIDDCIGILTAWACGATRLQAKFLLERRARASRVQ